MTKARVTVAERLEHYAMLTERVAVPLRELTDDLRERFVDAGLWQQQTIAQIVAGLAEEDPGREAVCDQTRRLTYAELVLESGRFAAFLCEAGVRGGEAVAVQSGNRVELAIAHLACSAVGATFVPLSDVWRETEMRHILSVSQAVVALVPKAGAFDYLGTVDAARAELRALRLVASADGAGDFDLPSILGGGPTGAVVSASVLAAVAADPNLPRYVMVSSGSTSLPKLSLWSDNNLWAFGRVWAAAVALNFKDRVVALAPAGTGAIGYVHGVLFPLLRGATSILMEKWEAAAALVLMQQERATVVVAVPTQLVKLMHEPSAETLELPELRVVMNAGAPMPPDAAAQLERVWDCRIQTVYGATDGGVPVMTRIEDSAAVRRSTVGRAVPCSEIRLIDAAGRDVGPGQAGEIIWRGPIKSHGYLNDAERTEEMFWEDGYYRSGDLAERNGDGTYRIVGRAKDMIIRGGQNISPLELEEVIGAHPSVAEVAVVGVPDAVYGERVCVAASVRPGAAIELSELIGFLSARRIAKFKLPERLELFDELPKTATGKTNKEEIRGLVSDR